MDDDKFHDTNVFLKPMDEQWSHHVIQCTVTDNGETIQAVAKINRHNEAKTIQELSRTVLKSFIPKYYGLYDIGGKSYFIMEDLNSGLSSPCVTDLKLGTRAWDLKFKSEVKKMLREYSDNSTSTTYGVRFISSVIRKNKKIVTGIYVHDGLSYSIKEFAEKLMEFLPEQHMAYIFKKIVRIRKVFLKLYKDLPAFRMYAGSLMVNYDGDKPETRPRLTIIDFAHTHIDIDFDGGDSDRCRFDDNIIRGLDTLITVIGLFRKPLDLSMQSGDESESSQKESQKVEEEDGDIERSKVVEKQDPQDIRTDTGAEK